MMQVAVPRKSRVKLPNVAELNTRSLYHVLQDTLDLDFFDDVAEPRIDLLRSMGYTRLFL